LPAIGVVLMGLGLGAVHDRLSGLPWIGYFVEITAARFSTLSAATADVAEARLYGSGI
jgi:hypothetical protein